MTSRYALILMAGILRCCWLRAQPAGRRAQTAQTSVAEASRKAKEQQKSEPKARKVFTDEDIARPERRHFGGRKPPPEPPATARQPNSGQAPRRCGQEQPSRRRVKRTGGKDLPTPDGSWPMTPRNWTFCSASTI